MLNAIFVVLPLNSSSRFRIFQDNKLNIRQNTKLLQFEWNVPFDILQVGIGARKTAPRWQLRLVYEPTPSYNYRFLTGEFLETRLWAH